MVHPFVRVHIIDMTTYKYIAKKSSIQPGMYNKESAYFIDSFKNFTKNDTDYLLPIST